jgi:pyruvate,water dikinase
MQHDQRIYFFGAGQADGGNDLKHRVGGKGASLAEMTRAGLNVPPGFTISAECCAAYFRSGGQWPDGLEDEVRAAVARLEELTGRPFGRGDDPLLVAVRSGAAVSMPGMMDTVLNVGLNPDCVAAQAERTGEPRAAWEAYRQFLLLFGRTVGGVPEATFADRIDATLRETGKPSEDELDAEQLQDLCGHFLDAYREHTGHDMPAEPWDALHAAVNAVFASWHSERAVTFRRHHRIDGLPGTAVNVQAMCPSEVAGVMFTADPVNPTLNHIVIESSYGLGEAVVLGKVTPDRFVLDRHSGRVLERHVAHKRHVIATLARDGHGQAGASDASSLSDAQLAELAALGRRVEAYFKVPCDVEWGLSAGQFYLLQARPIKRLAAAAEEVSEAEREAVRREEIDALAAKAETGGTVWARYNLAEILPHPTPLTWAVVRRFMSGRGGFGLMYRDLGFDPDPALDDEGIFDLVCGRPYCNLSREPRLQYRRLPFEHAFAALKANPGKAVYPQAVLNPARGGWRFWLGLPVIFFKLWRQSVRLRKLARTFADRFQKDIVAPFLAEVAKEKAVDLQALNSAALVERFNAWRKRTLEDFARDSLKPTALAGITLANLLTALARVLQPAGVADRMEAHRQGVERAQAALRELVMGVKTYLALAVREAAAGRMGREDFLARFGHRGEQEMELAQPRWAEDPASLERLFQAEVREEEARDADPQTTLNRIAAEAGLSVAQVNAISAEATTLRTYLALREAAKDYLMQGYALLRRVLVELDNRYQLNGGIFYLTPGELPWLTAAPTANAEILDLITRRKRRRAAALSLFVPQVLFSDDLEAVGREVEIGGAAVLQGVPLSAGVAEAPALVLDGPAGAKVPAEPYILVCPSTDPAWVPLFVHARGLVMETGGVLSHGAIVAREFGLPAVAGLPEVHRRVRTGQRLRIDGATGRVNVLA